MPDLLETVAGPVAYNGQTRLPKPGLQVVSASATTRNLAPSFRSKARPLRFSHVAKEILNTPSPSCLDFLTAPSGGRRFPAVIGTS
jgi:hypothetical protein